MLRSGRWGQVAAGWSLLFAALHLFWAGGGSLGLAESAGADLAQRRPTWFVVLGLYGVSLLLLAAAALGALLGRPRGSGRAQHLLRFLGAGVSAVLLLRAVGLEVLLLADPRYGNGAVSRAERFWALALWNPWFLIGGAAFGLATAAARRTRPRPGC